MNKRMCAALLVMFLSSSAHPEEETLWRDARASVTQLLNDGWSIHGFSSLDTGWRVVSSRDSPVAYPRTFEVNFILAKNGKWIWCAVTEPSIQSRTQSRCRLLN
jgi:hypothetical protein